MGDSGQAPMFQLRHVPARGRYAFEVSRVADARPLGTAELPGFVGWKVPGTEGGELREELRWYLEDFLGYPFSPHTERAERAQDALRAWGGASWEALFGRGRAGRTYEGAAETGLEWLTLEVVSDDPEVLGWPWEAIRDPAAGAACLDLRVVRRVEKDIRDPVAVSEKLPKDRVNVLLVTARPYAERDVAYRSISRRLFQLVGEKGLPAEITVLRPPTLDRLREVLREKPDYYHVLHFDGHGGFGEAGTVEPHEGQLVMGARAVGKLVFEDERGEPHEVDTDTLGTLLREHRIPAVVLNACRSGMLDERATDPFASVAAGLLHAGVRSVVAMAYSLYLSGAEVFLPAFYEALFREGDLSAATRAGRQQMLAHPERVCTRGRFPLQDWLVPVLYAQQPLDFSFAKAALRKRVVERPGLPPEPTDAKSPHGLIGRDRALLALERALRRPVPGVLLRGLGGIGKTTLAWAFLEWLSESGGLPPHVQWVDFREVRNAEWLLHTLGVPLFGETFRAAAMQHKIAALQQAARQMPLLWVWDNLEVAAGTPDSSVPGQLPEEDWAWVRRLLEGLRGSQAHVLITSRTEEGWLGGAEYVYRMPLGGLHGEERDALAEAILNDIGGRPKGNAQAEQDYADLLDWLDGHPLMMRVVLPQLQHRSARALRDALQRDLALVVGRTDPAEARLWAALHRVADAVPAALRPLLYLVSLHERYVDLRLLEPMAQRIGRGWTRDALQALLGILTHAGLAQPLGPKIWQLHPALGTFLAHAPLLPPEAQAPWRRVFTDGMGALANALAPRPPHKQRLPFLLCEGNFRRALGHAEALGMEAHVATLTQALGAWALNQRDWAGAERLYKRLAEHSEARGDGRGQAAAYHQLGIVAHSRRELMAAEGWYRKALAIQEKLGDLSSTAITYHQLGVVTQERRDFSAAKGWYHEALATLVKLQDEHKAASTYHQLGMLAQQQRDFAAAEGWYRKALIIIEKVQDEHGVAKAHHELGVVAQEQRSFAAAEGWYRKALSTWERVGEGHAMAQTCHQLGMLAHLQRDLTAAESWYLRSLAIKEKLSDENAAAPTYHQLGMVAQERRDLATAEGWYRKALAIDEKLGNDYATAQACLNLGWVAEEQRDLAAAEGWYSKSLAAMEMLGDMHGAAIAYHQIGILAVRRNRPLEAARAWLRALAGFLATQEPHNAQQTTQNYALLLQHSPPELQAELRQLWTSAGLPPLPDAVPATPTHT